jgi:hypothetical protein
MKLFSHHIKEKNKVMNESNIIEVVRIDSNDPYNKEREQVLNLTPFQYQSNLIMSSFWSLFNLYNLYA